MPNISWNPFSEFARIRNEMPHLFPDSTLLPMQGQPFNRMPAPSVDLHENEREIIISAEIAGVRPDELDVTVDELQITISGEIKRGADSEEDGYRMIERRYGRFSRTIPLPVEVKPDEATAEYDHGILEIRLNKADGGRIRSKKLQITKKQH